MPDVLEVYVSGDIEADGPIPGPYSMLSIGLSVVGRPDICFYTELKPISETFEPGAMEVNGLDRDRLIREAPLPEEAMKAVRGFLLEEIPARLGRATKVVLVFSPAAWDGMYFHWYCIRFLGENPLDVAGSAIDIRSYWMGMNACSWTSSRTKFIKESVGTLGVLPHTHHALDDAKEQGEVFHRVLLRNLDRSARVPLQWLPKGLGEVLMQEFSLPAGSKLGALRARLTDLCMSGAIEAQREAAYYVEVVRAFKLLEVGDAGKDH